MKPILAKLVRQVLFVAGGYLGAKSAPSDMDVETLTGALMVVSSLAWSWYNECKKQKGQTNAK